MSKIQNLTQGTYMITKPFGLEDEKSCFKLLFKDSDYKLLIQPSLPLINTVLINNLKFEGLIFEGLIMVEKELIKFLSTMNGRICIEVEEELSKDLMNTHIDSLKFDDLKTLPFDCFIIDLKYFKGIEKVLIYKTDTRLYFHFDNVNPHGFSIRLILEKDGQITPQFTYSSLFYHEEIENISVTINKLVEVCSQYILSVLLYLCCFQKDTTKVIKEMSYDNYLLKVSPKNQKKDKFIKKIESKNNTVKLKFVKNQIIYHNSHHSDTKTKRKVSTMFIVKGHWRDQRIGTRELKQSKKTWIPPHYRGVNNEICKEKLYMVS